jgi:hypothetical protein
MVYVYRLHTFSRRLRLVQGTVMEIAALPEFGNQFPMAQVKSLEPAFPPERFWVAGVPFLAFYQD